MNTLSIILPFHIIIALGSVSFTAWQMFRPSEAGLKICYALLGLVVASGSVLIIAAPDHMTQTCLEGLIFVGLSLAGIYAAKRRLAGQRI